MRRGQVQKIKQDCGRLTLNIALVLEYHSYEHMPNTIDPTLKPLTNMVRLL